MPSVRFSRDKRGYEYVYLVHSSARRGKPSRSRVLYWYRTPPGVKIGREPFDREVRETLERQYPGISFDWKEIVSTPMPPPDMTEVWRERRRAERAAKAERKAAEMALSADESGGTEAEPDAEGGGTPEVRHAAEVEVERLATPHHATDVHVTEASELLSADEPPSSRPSDQASATATAASGDGSARRRRRRGGRRRRGRAGQDGSQPGVDSPADAGAAGAPDASLHDRSDDGPEEE